MPTQSVKIAATVAHRARTYTDHEVSQLRAEIYALHAEITRNDRRGSRGRLINHLACLALGITLSLTMLALAASPVVATVITGIPSVLLEAVDRIARF